MPNRLTKCRACKAMANPAWLTCAACKEPLNPGPQGSIEAPAVLREASMIAPGEVISWERADKSTQHGVVDLVHTDVDGTAWAFVTTPESWVAVNAKYARVQLRGQ